MSRTQGKENALGKARRLRKEMTPQERKLWYCYIKKSPYHWYKQRIIDYYIADFYCPKARLVIEVDGSQHYTDEGIEYDKIRTEIINSHNIKTIRVTNKQIDEDFDNTCLYIDKLVNDIIESNAC